MAQSAASAYETVPAHYQAHSLQATFFRRAQCHKSVIYGVEVLNDGKTFSSRRVTAEQDGKSVISSVVSFIAKISSPSADTSERSSLSGTIVEHTSVPKMPIEVPKDYHDDLSYTRQDGLQPAVEGCRLPIVLQGTKYFSSRFLRGGGSIAKHRHDSFHTKIESDICSHLKTPPHHCQSHPHHPHTPLPQKSPANTSAPSLPFLTPLTTAPTYSP